MGKKNHNHNDDDNFSVNKSETQKSNFELRKEAELIKNSKEGRNIFVQLFESRKQIIEDFKNSKK